MDTLMAGQPWFRTWASESLLSDDLDALSDHEFRVWFNLLCLTSLQEPRWQIAYDASRLAKRCRSSAQKMAQTVLHLETLGMVEIRGEMLIIVNGPKYNEGSRKPSDLPAATRDRKRDERQRRRDMSRDDVTPLSRPDVTLRARKSERREEKRREEESRGEGEGETHAPGDGLPVGVRERRDSLLSRVPTRYRWDVDIIADHEQLAQECTDPGVLMLAIAQASRNGDFMSARNVRKYLPPEMGGYEDDDFEPEPVSDFSQVIS